VTAQRVVGRPDGSFAEFIALAGLGRQQVVIRAESAGGGVREETRAINVGK
jgi:hypothetical protein